MTDLNETPEAFLLALPRRTGSPLVERDVEAFHLGLLEDEHPLGGAVRTGPAGHFAVLADADVSGGGLLIVDQEGTPIAAVTDVQEQGGSAVRGRLVSVRSRGSGHQAVRALDRTDLRVASPTPSTGLLLLDRPPTTADSPDIDELVAGGSSTVWVIVADSPGNALPLSTLVATVQAWLLDIGATASGVGDWTLPGGRIARLRTAPIGWRDPVSDTTIVSRVAAMLEAEATCWLRADDASEGSRVWQSVLASLRHGATGEIAGISDHVARVLRRWRPAPSRRGLTLMFTGLSGSGKSTIARGVTDWLLTHTDRSVTLLDGDVVRQTLSSGLGYDREGRVVNVRRVGYVAAEVTRHGGVAVCALIAPYSESRAEVRSMVEAVGDFLLIHVNTPIEECERRDVKGLYARARSGALREFTGVSDLYDEPHDAHARIDTSVVGRRAAVESVVALLHAGGWLEGRIMHGHDCCAVWS